MTKRDYIYIGIGVLIFIMLLLPYLNVKPKDVKPEVDLIEQMRELNRENTENILRQVDEKLETWRRNDSLLNNQVKSTNARIKEIPSRVNNLDRDQLYREISRY